MAAEKKYEFIDIPNTKAGLNSYMTKRIAKNGLINSKEKDGFENHPGIRSAYTAFNMNRSPNTSYIYLLGVTGSGKSSTVNFLFDKEISPTGTETSVTTDTIEHMSEIKDSRLFIKNLSISIIDGPGLEDTGGVNADTKNILCHKKFLQTHPQLCEVKPNVVMITLSVTDTRVGDDKNTNTPFARMLKAVKEFLGPKLIDSKHPNVVFVLTNFHSLTSKRVKDELPKRIKTIKTLSAKCLGVIDPPVAVSENYPEEYDELKKDEHGWYHLRNGDKHPLKLFSDLIQLCKNSNDLIGQEVISKYFSQERNQSKVEKGHIFTYEAIEEDKDYQQVTNHLKNIKLDVKETEILTTLETKFSELPIETRNSLGQLTPMNVASFLELNNIKTHKNVPQDDKFLELFVNYNQHSPELLTFLQNALNIKLSRREIDTKVGSCYNVLSDNIIGNSVFKYSGEYKLTWAGFKIPKEVDIFEVNSTFARSEQFSSVQDYMRKRLADLSINADISFIDSKVSIRNGYSVSSGSSQNFSEKTILLERHCFRITVDEDRLELTERFKSDINELPEIYDKKNEANVSRWKDFFEKYGTHVTKTAFGGGACIATVKVASSDCNEESLHQLMVHIEERLSGANANLTYNDKTKSKNEKLFNTSSIHMEGGDPSYHVTNLKALTNENIRNWLASIQHRPAILTTKLELIPINTVVSSYRPSIRDTFSSVYQDLFGANLKYTPEANKTIEPPEMTATSRQDATQKSAPNPNSGSCLARGTKILCYGNKTLPIEQIKTGDVILNQNGEAKKVLGVNKILLGNRLLFGFEPYTEPFFTSEHIFATQNNQWSCVDPNELMHLNPQIAQSGISRMGATSKVLKRNGFEHELVDVRINYKNQQDKSTDVYCLIVEGNIYIANGFVTRDSTPNLLAWPSFAICSALLLSSKSAQTLHKNLLNIDLVEKNNALEILALKISVEWNEILEMQVERNISSVNNEQAIVKWMEKLTDITKLTDDENKFISDILSKPSLTYLAQHLYINCGENLHSNLGSLLRFDTGKFVMLTSQLYQKAESIIDSFNLRMID